METYDSQLRQLPGHIVQSYMTLKHMKMRDCKNRLQKILNFYRSIQKRIVLEAQEFARREAVNNHTKIRIPQETFYVNKKASNLEEKFLDMNLQNHDSSLKVKTQAQKSAELELEEDEHIATLIDIKSWKYKGQFNYKFLSTCPQPFVIDGSADKPMEERDYVTAHNLLKQTKQHISEQSKNYLNRMDHYQIDEEI